jgi:hypothetical protein
MDYAAVARSERSYRAVDNLSSGDTHISGYFRINPVIFTKQLMESQTESLIGSAEI